MKRLNERLYQQRILIFVNGSGVWLIHLIGVFVKFKINKK